MAAMSLFLNINTWLNIMEKFSILTVQVRVIIGVLQGNTIFIKKLKHSYHLCFEFFLLLCRLINSIQYIQSLLGFVKAIKAVSFLKTEFNVYPVKG